MLPKRVVRTPDTRNTTISTPHSPAGMPTAQHRGLVVLALVPLSLCQSSVTHFMFRLSHLHAPTHLRTL